FPSLGNTSTWPRKTTAGPFVWRRRCSWAGWRLQTAKPRPCAKGGRGFTRWVIQTAEGFDTRLGCREYLYMGTLSERSKNRVNSLLSAPVSIASTGLWWSLTVIRPRWRGTDALQIQGRRYRRPHAGG